MSIEADSQKVNRRHRFFYGYIVALAAFFIWFVSRGSMQTFGVFYKPMLTEFGWTRATLAGPRSMMSLVEGVLGVIIGKLADTFGPLKVVLIFGSFIGISMILMSQVSNIWQIYIVMSVLAGIGMSATGNPTMALVARWFVKRRGLMSGLVQTGAAVGGMVLPPLMGWLIVNNGWRPAYIVLGIISLSLTIVSASFLRRDPREKELLPYGYEEKTKAKDSIQTLDSPVTQFSLTTAVRTRQFWMIVTILFGLGMCRSIVSVHIAAHATDLGYPLAVGANILAIMGGAGIFSRVGMGRLADVVGNKRSLVIGYFLLVTSLLWLQVAKETWSLYLFAVTFGFSLGSIAVMRMPITAEVFGLSALASILAGVDFGTHFGSFVGPLLGGLLFDLTGKYTMAFLITAVITCIGLLMVLLLKPIRR
jgi:MFS family permease